MLLQLTWLLLGLTWWLILLSLALLFFMCSFFEIMCRTQKSSLNDLSFADVEDRYDVDNAACYVRYCLDMAAGWTHNNIIIMVMIMSIE